MIVPGGAGVHISSMAGHMPPPLDPERAHALAYTPTDDLLQLPILGPDAVPGSAEFDLYVKGVVAEMTVKCLANTCPASVPGVVFLSGGMSDEDATARLNTMNAMGPHAWEISFSYGRALQAPALKAWGGDSANVAAGQEAYLHRAKMNGLARSGSYSPDMEEKVAA